jgi:hypothetical protein
MGVPKKFDSYFQDGVSWFPSDFLSPGFQLVFVKMFLEVGFFISPAGLMSDSGMIFVACGRVAPHDPMAGGGRGPTFERRATCAPRAATQSHGHRWDGAAFNSDS